MSIEYHYTKNDVTLFWLGSRPDYCNRGKWHASVDAKHQRSDADPMPRYYFNYQHGMEEMLRWAIVHRIDCTGGQWRRIAYNDAMEKTSEPMVGPTPETLQELP